MIIITKDISIPDSELKFDFIRSSGPGGQNVNKVETAVQLRFNVKDSPSLSDFVKERLFKIAKNKISQDSILIIEAKRWRTQATNKEDAIQRFIYLVIKASEKPKIRRKTKATLTSIKARLEKKNRQSLTKKLRKAIKHFED
jgi:ribosome-associated protein